MAVLGVEQLDVAVAQMAATGVRELATASASHEHVDVLVAPRVGLSSASSDLALLAWNDVEDLPLWVSAAVLPVCLVHHVDALLWHIDHDWLLTLEVLHLDHTWLSRLLDHNNAWLLPLHHDGLLSLHHHRLLPLHDHWLLALHLHHWHALSDWLLHHHRLRLHGLSTSAVGGVHGCEGWQLLRLRLWVVQFVNYLLTWLPVSQKVNLPAGG